MDYKSLDLEPCRMDDKFYHIGVEKGPSYLLETSDGLVLIDTAFPQTFDLLLEHIRKIGKDPRDIRHVLHTHGHYDHIGATRSLVELSGAKTYIGAGDEDAVSGKKDLSYASELGEVFRESFEPDVILHDGDLLNFGDTEIRVVSTPGHTAGTVSFFFRLNVNGQPQLAGTFGGAGQNTLTSEYLNRYALPFSLRAEYLQSIDKIAKEPVEFHVGNHLSDNNFHEKARRMQEQKDENPFLTENTYFSFLERKKRQAVERFANGW